MGHLELAVDDPARSREWWTQVLGFQHVSDQGPYQWVGLGELEVLLRPGPPRQRRPHDQAEMVVTLYVEDAPAIAQALREHAVEFVEEDACLYLCDPCGVWIQIVDPGDHGA